MLHSQLRLQQLKKKKKMFRSHVDHFEWSNEFYKIFLRIIRVILLQSFLTCFFQFILLRLQNWNIPLLTLSTKENFVESFFKSIIFFFLWLFVIFLFVTFSGYDSRKDCWERYLWEETIGELGQIRIPHFYQFW